MKVKKIRENILFPFLRLESWNENHTGEMSKPGAVKQDLVLLPWVSLAHRRKGGLRNLVPSTATLRGLLAVTRRRTAAGCRLSQGAGIYGVSVSEERLGRP